MTEIKKTWKFRCTEGCGHEDIIVCVHSERDGHEGVCPECNTEGWKCVPSATFSTEKCSASIPDRVAKGRFSEVKDARKIAKDVRAARRRGDHEAAAEGKKEAKERGVSKFVK